MALFEKLEHWKKERETKKLYSSLGLSRLKGFNTLLSSELNINTNGMQQADLKSALERKSKQLEQYLVGDLAVPSWGPKGSQRDHERAQKRELKRLDGRRRGPSTNNIWNRWFNKAHDEYREQAYQGSNEKSSEDKNKTDPETLIYQNLRVSEGFFRYSWLYLGAALIGLMVMSGALFVDYQIMNEFWTRILSNEFMEVPSSLSSSVISKSAQVIFATAAFHFFLSKLPNFGRTIYITVFFALTAIMITGFGFLNADISMPTDPESISVSADEDVPSMNDALVAMGLAEPETPIIAAPVASEVRTSSFAAFGYFMEDARPIMWMLVPGLVFLVVTGIGALSLQVAEHNVQNFVKSLDYPVRKNRAEQWEELHSFNAVLDNLDSETQDGNVQNFDDWQKGAA